MNKLKKMLDGVHNKKLMSVFSPLTISALEAVYDDLLTGKTNETKSEAVYNYCLKCGLKGRITGNGYIIHK